MQTIIAAFDEIARRAIGAERLEIDRLQGHHGVMSRATEVAAALDAVDAETLAAMKLAGKNASSALLDAHDKLIGRQRALVEKTARPDLKLKVMGTPTTVVEAIASADRTINNLYRDHGEGFEAILDGKRLGDVRAYDISTNRTTLAIGELWSCQLDDIEAIGYDDGLAVLMRDGTLFEVRKTV